MVESSLSCLPPILFTTITRNGYELHLRGARILAKMPGYFEAIHSRQTNIEERNVRLSTWRDHSP